MPFKSAKQRRYMFKFMPKMAKKWARESKAKKSKPKKAKKSEEKK